MPCLFIAVAEKRPILQFVLKRRSSMVVIATDLEWRKDVRVKFCGVLSGKRLVLCQSIRLFFLNSVTRHKHFLWSSRITVDLQWHESKPFYKWEQYDWRAERNWTGFFMIWGKSDGKCVFLRPWLSSNFSSNVDIPTMDILFVNPKFFLSPPVVFLSIISRFGVVQ